MALFISLLPVYLLGNLHCLGMCGPLVLFLGKHRYRSFYFLGRTFSFALAGLLSGALGAVLQVYLMRWHLSAAASFFFGGVIFLVGLSYFIPFRSRTGGWLSGKLAHAQQVLSLLMLRDQPLATFLFGFFTIALPCGQTVIVYSACALYGDALVGFLNGAAFALMTSPALWMAMQAHGLLAKAKKYYHPVMGGCALLIGILGICRGLADAGVISHWVLNPSAPRERHIALF